MWKVKPKTMTTKKGAWAINIEYQVFLNGFKRNLFEELRNDSKEFFECVINKKSLAATSKALEAFFGPPAKPAGKAPTKDDEYNTERFGGIRSNQILYVKKTNSETFLCMVWPWGDGDRLTVKILETT